MRGVVVGRFDEGIDLDEVFDELHCKWRQSGKRLELVSAVKHCFKQILKVSIQYAQVVTQICFAWMKVASNSCITTNFLVTYRAWPCSMTLGGFT